MDHGILAPLVTPFDAAGAVDPGALTRLAHHLLDHGVRGLVALGTTAEVGALADGERGLVLDVCEQVARERDATLVVGVGGSDTAGVARGLAELAGRRVTAALVLVPPFTRPTPDGVVAHFRVLADQPVPLIVYDVPHRTGLVLSAATVLRLAEIPGVVGTKHALTAVGAETVALLADKPDGFAVLAGDDVVAPALLALGADGGILASAAVDPRGFADLAAAWHSGDVAAARALGPRSSALAAALFAEPNPVLIKAALHAQGLIPTADVRLPLLAAAPGAFVLP